MGLSRTQFDLMTSLEAAGSRTPTQRELAAASGRSVGTVNKTLKELQELGYVQKNQLTPQGLAALEPYRAKRAVFVAAGFGSRMVPITLNTPKPLVRVNGTRMIDTLLDAVVAAGIQEIYIVRGYLAEQFDQLLFKYPMIKFIENPAYNEAKNIASLMCARYLLQNAYVLEADPGAAQSRADYQVPVLQQLSGRTREQNGGLVLPHEKRVHCPGGHRRGELHAHVRHQLLDRRGRRPAGRAPEGRV